MTDEEGSALSPVWICNQRLNFRFHYFDAWQIVRQLLCWVFFPCSWNPFQQAAFSFTPGSLIVFALAVPATQVFVCIPPSTTAPPFFFFFFFLRGRAVVVRRWGSQLYSVWREKQRVCLLTVKTSSVCLIARPLFLFSGKKRRKSKRIETPEALKNQ